LKDRRHPAAGHRQRTPGKLAAARPVLQHGLAVGITESAPEPDNSKIHTPSTLQGSRTQIERIFGTITTEFLLTLAGYIPPGNTGKPVTPPALSLSQLDVEIGRYLH
jgi:hypothetical protein